MHILKDPFRPYFLLAALMAILVPMYFVCILINDYTFNEEIISSFAWHGHEMVFGFTSAVIIGFLLTASAKWTGKKTFSTPELLVSIAFWLFSRYILITQPSQAMILVFAPLPFIYILSKMFFILKGQKNFKPVVLVLTVMLGANFLHLKSTFDSNQDLVDMSYKIAGLALFALLYIFSGTLISFFTNNKFKQQIIQLNAKENILTLLLCLIAFLADIFSVVSLEKVLAPICFLLLMRRSVKLLPKNVLKTPMLAILSIGHLFLPIYFLLRFLILLNDELAVGRSDLHALFAGALGLIVLGMITRVSLGHTGREIVANKLIQISFVSTIIGTILRVFHPIILDDAINIWLHTSMGFWTLGYILYIIRFIKILFTPRPN
jgi:uncharacterized protein involved in response to NO